jgi:hypothetical protein
MATTAGIPDLVVERASAGVLLARVSGNWREPQTLPGVEPLRQLLREEPSVKSLEFDTARLTGRDARFVAFINQCAGIVRERDIQPARRLVKLDFDERRLYDSLREKRWDVLQFFTEGELSPLLPLVHRLWIANFGAARTTRAAKIAFQKPTGQVASDTGELLWEATDKGTGRLTINTPHTQAAIGWLGGRTLHTTDAEFRPFCGSDDVSLPTASRPRLEL